MEETTKAKCADCGLEYGCEAWADVVVPDTIWNMIVPSNDLGGSGLLCFNCMNARLSALKLRNVPCYIASGPFAFMVRDITGETKEAMSEAIKEVEAAEQLKVVTPSNDELRRLAKQYPPADSWLTGQEEKPW